MKDAPLRHAVEFGFFRLLQGLVRALPHRASRPLGRALGTVAYRALGSRRRVALANLERALPDLDGAQRQAIARGAFRQMTAHAAELLSWARFDPAALCRHWTLEGWDNVVDAAADGAVFLMTAHFGYWELISSAAGLYVPPLSALVRPLDNPRLERVLGALRSRFGLDLIHKHGAARQLVRCLSDGGRIVVLLDQRVRARDSVEVPFFGRPARTTKLIARLAHKHETPVIPIFVYPAAAGRYRIVAREAIVAEGAGDDPIRELTASYLAAVEAEIRLQPELWLWMHDRWRLT